MLRRLQGLLPYSLQVSAQMSPHPHLPWPPILKRHDTQTPPHSSQHYCDPYPAAFFHGVFSRSWKDSLLSPSHRGWGDSAGPRTLSALQLCCPEMRLVWRLLTGNPGRQPLQHPHFTPRARIRTRRIPRPASLGLQGPGESQRMTYAARGACPTPWSQMPSCLGDHGHPQDTEAPALHSPESTGRRLPLSPGPQASLWKAQQRCPCPGNV